MKDCQLKSKTMPPSEVSDEAQSQEDASANKTADEWTDLSSSTIDDQQTDVTVKQEVIADDNFISLNPEHGSNGSTTINQTSPRFSIAPKPNEKKSTSSTTDLTAEKSHLSIAALSTDVKTLEGLLPTRNTPPRRAKVKAYHMIKELQQGKTDEPERKISREDKKDATYEPDELDELDEPRRKISKPGKKDEPVRIRLQDIDPSASRNLLGSLFHKKLNTPVKPSAKLPVLLPKGSAAERSSVIPIDASQILASKCRVVLDTTEPQRFAVKSSIVSNNVLTKLGFPVGPRIIRKRNNKLDMPCNEVGGIPVPETRLNEPRIGMALESECNGLRGLQPECTENYFPVSCSTDKPPPCNIDLNSIEPISRSTGTQTNISHYGREIFNIFDTDVKLLTLSGIPSHEVLDSITEAILKSVINNEAMKSDVQPTMREWIILTCTKFVLKMPLKAVAVMFGIPSESECSRIIEKTCLFLRKTLSTSEYQKYVWALPNDVLNGIADTTDGVKNSR